MSKGILSRFVSTQVVICISMDSHRVLIEGELEYVKTGRRSPSSGEPHSPTLLVLNEKNRKHIIREWTFIGQTNVIDIG